MEKIKYVILLIFLIIVILLVFNVANVFGKFKWEEFEGWEKYLSGSGGGETTTSIVNGYSTGSLPNATRAASNPNEYYYVSEIACDIAKTTYSDFTYWGEYGRDNIEEKKAFYEITSSDHKNLCEYDTKANGYFCFVGGGKFNLSLMTLTQDDRDNLTKAGCWKNADNTAGCTHGSGIEYKLDEVCVNEVFSNLEMPPVGSGLPACTIGATQYIYIGVNQEKFGNNGCYYNSDNCIQSDEGWNDWCTSPNGRCQSLCNAEGNRRDGSLLLTRDYDKISFWGSDQDSSLAVVNDSYFSQNKETVADGRPYFYIVYWNNSDKRYTVDIPRITPDFPEDHRDYDSTGFHDFLLSLFNDYTKRRSIPAGMWYPELRTVYDGNITLSGSGVPIITNLFLNNLENGIGGGIKFHEGSCQKGSDCLDYTVNLEVFDLARQGGDVYVRIGNDISVDTIPSGNYRVIVRDWISDLYHSTLTLTDQSGVQTVKDARYMDRTIIICKDNCS